MFLYKEPPPSISWVGMLFRILSNTVSEIGSIYIKHGGFSLAQLPMFTCMYLHNGMGLIKGHPGRVCPRVVVSEADLLWSYNPGA